ncbi:GNAT family N-acetyltransferase [Parasphingopyxis sp.]|uniref:GNAT family N-acetyltransferase n=1 Tax=Parasphingopyxis sp. TaxID=1920299 RepID=UPI00262C94A8|nr:GNAT family N-acetyltransferase [Parasphingopyxis sp.]
MTVNVKLFDSLADAAADAGDALARAHQSKLYDRMSWFEMTLRHCGSADAQPLVARARCDTAAAWLFLWKTGARDAEALASWYTLEYDAVRTSEDERLLAAIAEQLKGFATISLEPIADPTPISRAFEKAGWRVSKSVATENWQLSGPSDFESFWKARPGKLRSTVKRKGKKADLDIVIHRTFDEQAWDDYRQVYAESWKPEEGSWSFMREFAETEGEAGTLRLGIAYREGVPVAAQFWHVENDQATIYKLAYSESAKSFSPGSILSHAMFQHVIEQDAPDIIDYGTGNQGYKADWMDGARPLYRLDMLNPGRPAAWPSLARTVLSGLVRRASSD